MKVKWKICIDEFDSKFFKIRHVEPKNNEKAILTHYLHNIHSKFSQHYKKDALNTFKKYIQYKEKNENISIVAEDVLQQLLFEVKNVPFSYPRKLFV